MTRTERGKRPRAIPFGARVGRLPFVAHARWVDFPPDLVPVDTEGEQP